LLVEEEDLIESLSQQAYIDIATDGSYNPESGISSFGWAIIINDLVVATGQGPAEAHLEMADPLRAETYGLASSAYFLNILVKHCHINPTDHVWTIYLDNMSLIKQMEANNSTGFNFSKMDLYPPRRHYTNGPRAPQHFSRDILACKGTSRSVRRRKESKLCSITKHNDG
jgi:hypothetical protein